MTDLSDTRPRHVGATSSVPVLSAGARGILFHSLAALLAYPSTQLTQHLLVLSEYLGTLTVDERVAEFQRVILEIQAIVAARAVDERQPGARAARYIRLFKHVSPYESEYTCRRIFFKTNNLADVAGFYHAFGFQMKEGTERPDHLEAELQFLALLSIKEAAASERCDIEAVEVLHDAQRKFLSEHLGLWAHLFSDALLSKCEEWNDVETTNDFLPAARLLRNGVAFVMADFGLPMDALQKPADSRGEDALNTAVDAETIQCPFAPPPEPDSGLLQG